MKKIFFLLIAIVSSAAAAEDWSGFYPLHVGDSWDYLVYYRGRELRGRMDVTRSYREDGREYFVMRNDENDVEYHVGPTPEVIWLKRWRYPLPLFKFIKYTITLNPPAPMIKYPLAVGKRWVYVGHASVMKFFGRDVATSFLVKEQGVMNLALGDVSYFKVSGLVNDGSSLYEEFYYYGRGVGYIKGWSAERRDLLLDYRPAMPRGAKPAAPATK